MPVEQADLDRLRDELLAAMRAGFAEYGAGLEARFDARLVARTAESEARLGARLEARIDASAAETLHQIHVIAEDLKSKVAVVAEGVITLTQTTNDRMREGFEIVDRRLLRLETRLLSAG